MRTRIAALALIVGLGLVGLVSAEETGNWFTRLFTPGAAKTEPAKTDAGKDDLPPVPTSSARRARKAKADLERRQEVCLKLRELALANGDDDALSRIELLENRAYDLFVAGTSFRSLPAVVTETKKGGR